MVCLILPLGPEQGGKLLIPLLGGKEGGKGLLLLLLQLQGEQGNADKGQEQGWKMLHFMFDYNQYNAAVMICNTKAAQRRYTRNKQKEANAQAIYAFLKRFSSYLSIYVKHYFPTLGKKKNIFICLPAHKSHLEKRTKGC